METHAKGSVSYLHSAGLCLVATEATASTVLHCPAGFRFEGMALCASTGQGTETAPACQTGSAAAGWLCRRRNPETVRASVWRVATAGEKASEKSGKDDERRWKGEHKAVKWNSKEMR